MRRYMLQARIQHDHASHEALGRPHKWIKDTLEWDDNPNQNDYINWPWVVDPEHRRYLSEARDSFGQHEGQQERFFQLLEQLYYTALTSFLAKRNDFGIKEQSIVFNEQLRPQYREMRRRETDDIVDIYHKVRCLANVLLEIAQHVSELGEDRYSAVINQAAQNLVLPLHSPEGRGFAEYADSLGEKFSEEQTLEYLGIMHKWPQVRGARKAFSIFWYALDAQDQLFDLYREIGTSKNSASRIVDQVFVALFSTSGWYHSTPNPKRYLNRASNRRRNART